MTDTGAGTPLTAEEADATEARLLDMIATVRAARSRPDPAGLDVERLARAMSSDEEMFRLLWPDENGLTLAAQRVAAEYARLSVADGPGPEEPSE